MRLAHIKLAGFKSFVDPTAIAVSQDLVGIVGPNGCGKSNIIDAVRWVLGESKASALRGDSMQDVIFSGSDHRKAISRASVEIVFNNHLSKITGQWSSYAEIAIKRVLQRDGVSSYYINNLQVRRRDIADLFLGTGIGGRGYAIIEQGMISRIIEAKPQELKNFLEEAAGISQYRERRQETFSRLEETRKNLARIEDLCLELKTHLQRLEIQAEIAQQYQSLQEKLHISQCLLWLQRKSDAMNQRTNAEKEIQRLEVQLQTILSKQHDAEKEYEATRAKEYAASDKLLQVQGQLYAANAEISRLEQEINHLRSMSERLAQQIREIENQLKKSNQLKEVSSENLCHWRQEKIQAESIHIESILRNDEKTKELPHIEADFLRCQEELTNCRQKLLLTEQANQLEDSHLTHATKNIQQLEARYSRLLQEQSELVFIDLSRLAELQLEMDQAENTLKQLNLKHQDIENQLSVANQRKHQITHEIQELQHALSQATARFNALQNLQQKLESNQNLNIWQRNQRLDLLPRLWQKIQIQPEWENALEAVLRERLNSIEFEQLDLIQHWIHDAPSGKWTIFEKTQPVLSISKQESTTSPASYKKLLAYMTVDLPEIQSVLEDWLGHVYVIEDIQEGLIKRSTLNSGAVLVTRQGHMITRTSFTFYAPDSQLHGVLSRQQELKNIQIEIDRLESLLHDQRDLLEAANQQDAQLSHAIQESHQNSRQTQQRRHDLQLEIVKLSQISERTIHRNNQINSELTEIKQALDSEISLQEATKIRSIKNLEQIDALKKLTQQAQRAWEAANHLLASQRQSIQQSTKQVQEATFHVKTCENKISEIEHNLESLHEDLQCLTQSHLSLLKEKNSLDEAPFNKRLEVAQIQRKLIEHTVLQTRQEVEDITCHLREIENTRMASDQELSSLRETISQIRLKEQAANITINQFDELLNDAKIDTKSLSSLIEKKSIAALQSEINRLNADISALGSVNLAALEELEAARARESSLLMQLQDLNEAIATLENVVQQIDRETRLRLQETFDLVNQYLSEIFPVIFAGGQAKLELSDDKILDAGLILMAQPPGKKNSSIYLLSGGEKALTALALVFSLFRLNPAPFCLLDEVDAPLDDSNTHRFCGLVKNMSKQTQFLFISHNKITMEMAQQLIGVTMQEQGVSRIVAVDIADAIKMGKRIKQI
ncbi:chromosome segregation protein SMC [Nitrosomonas sp. Nm166]|uniref:chromosome segregation protein SMC n=1 Tax=Nitrosomonas sp. Nm166 TaxID=1881054 RepID=UPI0008E14CD7|nr:chromosome segregation protein SMC [Nitrosomonas sp. Nm166]SFE08766.1 condensin subunit Smc [Nitrosomonas sp. Nm166]